MPELKALLPEIDLDSVCAGHKPPEDGRYPIRGVVLFGLAEMQRSAVYAEALKKGDMKMIGELMKISHDGDRVAQFNEKWQESEWSSRCDNAYIMERLADLESGDVVFYAVGLAHLLNNVNGLVDTLREAGYTVELVNYAG